MAEKRLWLKKYNYVPEFGNLYLIADVVAPISFEILIFHEFTIRYEKLDEPVLDYKRFSSDNITRHQNNDVELQTLVQTVIERRLALLTDELAMSSKPTSSFLPFKEVDSGKSVLKDLQLNHKFSILKDRLREAERSTGFREFMDELVPKPFILKEDS